MAQWIRRPPTERKIPGSIPGVEACTYAMLEDQSMHDQHYYMMHCAVQVALPDNRTTLTQPGSQGFMPF